MLTLYLSLITYMFPSYYRLQQPVWVNVWLLRPSHWSSQIIWAEWAPYTVCAEVDNSFLGYISQDTFSLWSFCMLCGVFVSFCNKNHNSVTSLWIPKEIFSWLGHCYTLSVWSSLSWLCGTFDIYILF